MPNRKVDIDMDRVGSMLNAGFAIKDVAHQLHLSYRTLRERLKKEGRQPKQLNASVSDEDLRVAVEEIKRNFPNHGVTQMMGALKAKGIRVYRDRVWRMLQIVDPEGILARSASSKQIRRQKYHVNHSHEVWHVDTCLKLGRYKIVIRGGVDGYSRTIVFLEAGFDNTAKSNYQAFVRATKQFGIPVKLRVDKGKENMRIAAYMLSRRGHGKRAVITGSSVHNQRIEKFWEELGASVLPKYRRWFQDLEARNLLDPSDPVCLASLHAVFMGPLQKDLHEYRQGHHVRKIRTANHMSPSAMLIQSPMPAELLLPHAENNDVDENDLIQGMRSSFSIVSEDENGQVFNDIRVDEHVKNIVKPVFETIKRSYEIRNCGTDFVQMFIDIVTASRVAHLNSCVTCEFDKF